MRVAVQVDADWAALTESEVRSAERAVSRAVGGATTSLKSILRDQVKTSGLGGRLAQSIRSEVYPRGQPSINAAGLTWSKAPKIVSAFAEGETIRSANGFWLAIPFPNIGKGPRGGKMTPGQWERRTGRQLRFIYRKGRTALLVDEGKKAPGNVFVRRRTRRGTMLMEPRTFKNRAVPIFTLVPQVRLQKRLNIEIAVQRATQNLSADIVANWK